MSDRNFVPGLVSVIIPSFNHAKFIRAAVESVLRQTYHNLELLILDDGSRDASMDYLRSVTDPRAHVSAHENMGAHATINKGLSLARGEFLTILNSDDVFEPRRLEVMVDELQKDQDCGLLCSWIECIDEKGKSLGIKQGWKNMEPWPVAHPEMSFKATDDFLLNLSMANFISTTSNMVFRRSVFLQVGEMRNLRFAHDWDFALRVALSYRCRILDASLMKYRIHSTNTISSNRRHMLFEIVWIYATHLSALAGAVFGVDPSPSRVKVILESINLQGNDRLLWALLTYFAYARASGRQDPELDFLNDSSVREPFFSYIVE